ncbi:DJ-1/PfpI family protein [Candidatus Woesearchaeota archaeon]|nr:DJ-1/PfpI family protein [Candidatus Woesearchaeota archaeon]
MEKSKKDRKLRKIVFLLIMLLIAGCSVEKEKVGVKKMGEILVIVAQKDFQPVEYGDTKAELEKAGYDIDVASIKTDVAVGADNSEVKPDVAVKDADLSKYKAIVLIGGPGAHKLGEYDEVLDLIKEADKQGKVAAAICIAPTILAKAGVLEGRKATVWNGDGKQGDVLTSAGAEFIDESVVQDGKIVTANGPAAAKDFGKKIVEVLG